MGNHLFISRDHNALSSGGIRGARGLVDTSHLIVEQQTTKVMSSTSNPLAATSVATKVFVAPLVKSLITATSVEEGMDTNTTPISEENEGLPT